jgi:hypothetical protein
MKRIFFSLFVSFGIFDLFGQNLLSQQSKLLLLVDVSYQRMDAFLNMSAQKRIKYFEFGTSFGIGIEKTIFQQQFSPHFELYSFFNLIQREIGKKHGFTFGPGILLDITSFQLQTPIIYKDAFLSYNLSVGRKFKFIHQAGFGIMNESFNSNNVKVSNNSYNYFVKAGLAYAFY